jgi:hypothetical protein
MTYTDINKQWLTGVPDVDGYNFQNWIRSGTVTDQTGSTCLASFNDYFNADNEGVYENVLGGIWAPYRLCAVPDATPPPNGPCYSYAAASGATNLALMKYVASVDIVFTSDKSKWTRCCVIEECEDPALSQPLGSFTVSKLDIRAGASVDKQGIPTGSPGCNESEAQLVSTTGMGWFPGYAINLETGERLNMAFGENSWMQNENGRDMIWNPTPNLYADNGDPLFGGMHIIYVFGHNVDASTRSPRYDMGQTMRTVLNKTGSNVPSIGTRNTFYSDAMWVNYSLAKAGYTIKPQNGLPSDVKVRLRVKKNYAKNYTTTSAPDSANPSQNQNKPMYSFNTSDLHVHLNDNESAVNALDLINVVPNPYYAYSEYEKNQIDNRIKVTNLPEKCTVKIFTLNGVLVRTFNKDDPKTSLDWDLKNQKGIPIASGMYIIYVNVEGVGEKVLKWFGVLRPLDLDQF